MAALHQNRRANTPSDTSDADGTRRDDLREQFIRRAGVQLEAAYSHWEVTGCAVARHEAERWRVEMERSIKGRSAAQIARLEQQRGLL